MISNRQAFIWCGATKTSLLLCLFSLLSNSPFPTIVTAFVHPLSPLSYHLQKLNYKDNNNDNNDDDGPIEYNDFNFEAGDSNDNNKDFGGKSLKSRFEQVHEEERLNNAVIAQNWRRGNWNVRGFSLDRYNPIDNIKNNENDDNDDDAKRSSGKAIDISHLSLITTLKNDDDDSTTREGNNDNIVVVGRTDGSVVMVEVGTQYWTKFDSKMTAKMEGDSMSVESQLVRSASSDNDHAENDFITSNDNDVPFEVLHQFTTPAKKEITSLLSIENDDHSYTIITGDIDGNIMIHDILYDNNNEAMINPRLQEKFHSNKIVALQLVTINEEGDQLVASVSTDGTIKLSSDYNGMDIVYEYSLDINVLQEEYNSDDTLIINSADVYEGYLFLGLSTGHVLTYKVDELMEQKSQNPMPNGKFQADTATGIAPGITAIACGGKGRLDGTSVIIVTGSADGTIKQWELLPRKRLAPETEDARTSGNSINSIITKIEHWPRLANQRMSKRAHLFQPGHTVSAGPVTSLAYNADIPSHFVSAGEDGTARAWNSMTGEELFVLDGFSSPARLCLTRNTLLTSGMKQFVCVHDFNVDINNIDKGFELEW